MKMFFTFLKLPFLIFLCFPSIVFSTDFASLIHKQGLSSVCSGERGAINWSDGRWVVNSFESKHTNVLKLQDMLDVGKSADEIVMAMRGAGPNSLIVGVPDLRLDLKGKPIILANSSSIDGRGLTLYSTLKIHSFIKNHSVSHSHEVKGLVIQANGQETYASISFKNVDGLLISGNTISGNTNSAIVVASSVGYSSRNIFIGENTVHSPSDTVGHVIMVKSTTTGKLINCVAVFANYVLGTFPENRTLGDYTPENSYTADQIVLHGVDGFLVNGNYSGWSGSAGYTVSRLSSNGVIYDNIAEHCYEPGFNIGAGFEGLTVRLEKNVRVGDVLTNGKALLRVQSVRKKAQPRTFELRGQVQKNVFRPNDNVFFYGEPDQILGTVLASSPSAENIILAKNDATDTAIQRRKLKVLAAYNVIRSKDIFLVQNRFSNPDDVGRANRFASFSVSNGYVSADSIEEYGRANIQVAGPESGIIIVK